MLPHTASLKDRVDNLLSIEKTIAGSPEWKTMEYEGQYRWLATTQALGTLTNVTLVVDAYPRHPSLKFTLTLNYLGCVVRLDYGDLERHNNHKVKGIPMPPDIFVGWVYGHHCHQWKHNRVLATHSKLPKALEYACTLPANVRDFHDAFRWFCGEANIIVAANEMPSLPSRDTFI